MSSALQSQRSSVPVNCCLTDDIDWKQCIKNTLNPGWTNSSTCLPPDHSPSRYPHFFIWPSRISSLLQWPSKDKWVFSLIDLLQSVSHFNTPSQTVLLKSSRHHLTKSRSLFSASPQSSFWWQRTWLTSSPSTASVWSPAAGSSISADVSSSFPLPPVSAFLHSDPGLTVTSGLSRVSAAAVWHFFHGYKSPQSLLTPLISPDLEMAKACS